MIAILIDPRTDGAVPIRCKLKIVDDVIQIEYGGLDGWILQIPIKELRRIIDGAKSRKTI